MRANPFRCLLVSVLLSGCGSATNESGKIWGWVAIQESSVVCDLHNEWCGPVRARFAEAPSYRHSLYHQRVLLFCREKEKSGDCAYYAECGVPSSERRSCYQSCPAGQECLGSQCVKLPAALDAGEIAIGGLKEPVRMLMDAEGKYQANIAAGEDIFDTGSAIRAHAVGAKVPAFSIQAVGVEDIKGHPETVKFSAGKAAVVSWTPAQTGARVEVILIAGWHYPFLPGGAVLCDAPDAQGEVSIAGSLVDKFLDAGAVIPYSHGLIGRYTRGLTEIPGGRGEIELFVSSLRPLGINLE